MIITPHFFIATSVSRSLTGPVSRDGLRGTDYVLFACRSGSWFPWQDLGRSRGPSPILLDPLLDPQTTSLIPSRASPGTFRPPPLPSRTSHPDPSLILLCLTCHYIPWLAGGRCSHRSCSVRPDAMKVVLAHADISWPCEEPGSLRIKYASRGAGSFVQ